MARTESIEQQSRERQERGDEQDTPTDKPRCQQLLRVAPRAIGAMWYQTALFGALQLAVVALATDSGGALRDGDVRHDSYGHVHQSLKPTVMRVLPAQRWHLHATQCYDRPPGDFSFHGTDLDHPNKTARCTR